eukprot:6002788-Prymnesium_polylepis.1
MVQAQTHQTCPDVPQTPGRPDAQTPARRLPDACQKQPDAARRSQTFQTPGLKVVSGRRRARARNAIRVLAVEHWWRA